MIEDENSNSAGNSRVHGHENVNVKAVATGYNTGENRTIPKPQKKLVQLTFENVVIKTIPPTRKCCKKIPNPPPAKLILDGVNGTILPG
jgi:hypothetical protein